MRQNRRRARRRRPGSRGKRWGIIVAAAVVAVAVVLGILLYRIRDSKMGAGRTQEDLLFAYMECIPQKEYEKMYEMLDATASGNISEEDFIARNRAIYEGIELSDMEIEILESDQSENTVSYRTTLETLAGTVRFENEAEFTREKGAYRLVWRHGLIFPDLEVTDKVRVSTTEAKRGKILDRNGEVLAGEGKAASVGIVPGKLPDNRQETLGQLAQMLETDVESMEKKLSAGWVKADSFVPIKTIPKDLGRETELLAIPGVMISDISVRQYPLGEAAAHLIGYVQSVTAEDLEEHEGEGYTAESVIGRSGMEGLFEKQLKGENGYRIYIEDASGREKEELAARPVVHGQDVRLTIDADLQRMLYEQFREDKGCSVAMNPCTGEVLALVSTPSYDDNAFILGLSDAQWSAWNGDEARPLYNRFRQTWCPGSTFKPVTAAIGLSTGAIDPGKDYGSEGLRWQKDRSWGSYYVTTLHTYEPVTLENALIYSDNIYFAKAALAIGAEDLTDALDQLGFGQALPFEIAMAKSQYSNTDTIETEIQLVDSGYGQGQVLVNPLHLACLYTAFCNEGNIIKPTLLYQEERAAEYWIPEAFSGEIAGQVQNALIEVVNNPNGTGYDAHREDVVLAGKTGTAEIKASQTDTSGTELGWFAVYTPERATERPIMIVSMVEDVKGRGGSGYVVEKDKQVLEAWFAGN